jgi:disulfide oxidoreductase YuzD
LPSVKAAAAIKASLGRMYGAAVRVCYYDTSQPDVQAEHHELLAALREDRLPLPAVVLDGQILYAGTVNPLRVVAAVAQEWQRRQDHAR